MTVILQTLPNVAKNDFVQKFDSNVRSQEKFQTFLESFKTHDIKTATQQKEPAKLQKEAVEPPHTKFTPTQIVTKAEEPRDTEENTQPPSQNCSSPPKESTPHHERIMEKARSVDEKTHPIGPQPDARHSEADFTLPEHGASQKENTRQIEPPPHSPATPDAKNTSSPKAPKISGEILKISAPQHTEADVSFQPDVPHAISLKIEAASRIASYRMDLERAAPKGVLDNVPIANKEEPEARQHIEQNHGTAFSSSQYAAKETEKVEINSRLVKDGALSDVTIYLDDGSCFKYQVETRNSVHTSSFVEHNSSSFLTSKKGIFNYFSHKHKDKR